MSDEEEIQIRNPDSTGFIEVWIPFKPFNLTEEIVEEIGQLRTVSENGSMYAVEMTRTMAAAEYLKEILQMNGEYTT